MTALPLERWTRAIAQAELLVKDLKARAARRPPEHAPMPVLSFASMTRATSNVDQWLRTISEYVGGISYAQALGGSIDLARLEHIYRAVLQQQARSEVVDHIFRYLLYAASDRVPRGSTVEYRAGIFLRLLAGPHRGESERLEGNRALVVEVLRVINQPTRTELRAKYDVLVDVIKLATGEVTTIDAMKKRLTAAKKPSRDGTTIAAFESVEPSLRQLKRRSRAKGRAKR